MCPKTALSVENNIVSDQTPYSKGQQGYLRSASLNKYDKYYDTIIVCPKLWTADFTSLSGEVL